MLNTDMHPPSEIQHVFLARGLLHLVAYHLGLRLAQGQVSRKIKILIFLVVARKVGLIHLQIVRIRAAEIGLYLPQGFNDQVRTG